jgi:hypothetical protein
LIPAGAAASSIAAATIANFLVNLSIFMTDRFPICDGQEAPLIPRDVCYRRGARWARVSPMIEKAGAKLSICRVCLRAEALVVIHAAGRDRYGSGALPVEGIRVFAQAGYDAPAAWQNSRAIALIFAHTSVPDALRIHLRVRARRDKHRRCCKEPSLTHFLSF